MDSTTAYHIIYQPTLTWWWPALGLAFVCLGLLIFAHSRRRLFALVFLGFAILWTVATLTITVTSYWRMRSALADPATPMVEGIVTNFEPEPPEGHRHESFDVGGVRFAYSYYIITGGYNRSASHGGVIHPGMRVRLRYLRSALGNLIVSIEQAP